MENGKICFIPWVIAGEEVKASIQKEKAGYAEATLAEVLKTSPHRVEAPCPYFRRCGGCRYQHITYEEQVGMKAAQLADVLRRLGGIATPNVSAAIPSPLAYGYRNRINVHAAKGRVGFYEEGSSRVVDIERCLIASDSVNEQLAALRKERPRDGEYALREPSSFRGFRQVNDHAAPLLVEVAREYVGQGGGLLVDAYCGAGFFAKELRRLFDVIVGIEWSEGSVQAARETAGEGESYVAGDVALHIGNALARGESGKTTVLLDPPSEGVAPEVIETLLLVGPARVIYISCNPATLARDLKRLGPSYRLDEARVVDMFPQTAEIEAAALLSHI